MYYSKEILIGLNFLINRQYNKKWDNSNVFIRFKLYISYLSIIFNAVLLLKEMLTTSYKYNSFFTTRAVFNKNAFKTIISHRIEIFLTYNVSFGKKLFDGDF